MGQFLPFFGRSSSCCMEYYAIFYMLLVVTQMMLDSTLFQTIINIPPESEVPINLYQCILVPVHCLQATLQFFFGFDFYKAIIKKSFSRARNWKMVFLCLLAIETSVFVAHVVLASLLSLFTYVTMIAILYKVYLLWPLKMFLKECDEVCVPLAHAASTQLLADHGTAASRPGPSSYSGSGGH